MLSIPFLGYWYDKASMIILLHSSKTMQATPLINATYQSPLLLAQANELAAYLKTLTVPQLKKSMQISEQTARKTHVLLSQWSTDPSQQIPAIDAFLGDIYSGLQTQTLTSKDRQYANKHLYILSGLYGVLRALDSICPYRLEMGYRLPNPRYKNLYSFWDSSIADTLPNDDTVINLSALEYTKAVLPYLSDSTVISPKFMTRDVATGEAKFVVVHAKIARGAFAHWLITQKIESPESLHTFTNLNYRYDASLSSNTEPVFVCDTFGGLGLSVRITKAKR